MGKPQFGMNFYKMYPFHIKEKMSMKRIDAHITYETIKIKILEQNIPVRHSHNKSALIHQKSICI
jgi:hypothetical protein